MNINAFKFKNQQSNNPFFSNSSPSKHDEKYPSIKPIPTKKVYQSIFKSQHSSREQANITRKSRYDTLEEPNFRISNIKSLSLERKTIPTEQKQGKSTLFKNPNEINKKDPKSSLERQKKSLSLYSNKNKRTLFSKKLTILNNDTIESRSKDSKKSINVIESPNLATLNNLHKKISDNHRKLRVNSTFCKLESLQLNNSDIYESSSKTLTGRRKTNEMQKKPSNLNQNVQMAKILIKSEQYSKALTILKQVLNEKNNKLNSELIELLVSCMYYTQKYQEATRMYENIRDIQQRWSSQFYTMVCISYAKQKLYKISLLVIEKAVQNYRQNPQIFYYKGKMLYHMKKYDLAVKSFKMSNELHQLPQTLLCLVDCYRKTNQKEKELQTISTILCCQKSNSVLKWQDFQMRKFKLLFQLGRYSELLEDFQSLQKNQSKILKKSHINPQMQFLYGFSNYKLDLLETAHEKFEDLITSQNMESQSLKMLIIIQIKSRNFYEASRLCNQVVKKQQRIRQNDIFKLLTSFVQGSINLVRRNFKDGIQRLSQVKLLMQGLEKRKPNVQNKNEMIFFDQISDIEGLDTVQKLLNLFLGYGLFCIGQYQYCQSSISKQRTIYNDPQYEKNMSYNYTLCSAILSYQAKQYEKVLGLLDQAEKIYPQRMQIYFYRAVVMIKGLLKLIDEQEVRSKHMQLIWQNIYACQNKLSLYGNNPRATILYYKSVLHSYLKDWKHAITTIDECISLSDENYWRYYYCKGMILACVHNFEQAITELNVAVAIADGLKAECFLLRSRCLQIQGRGSQAFADLQKYIALRPNDEDVHKYAGQILFQNGAFQDALTAFQHHQIPQIIQNYDVYLTLAKTLFLTGKFNSAQQKMIVASKLKPEEHQIQFDSKTLGFLDKLVTQIRSKTVNEHKSQLIDQLKDIFFKDEGKKGKIFHYCDGFLFQALINLYSGDYAKAIENFQRHLSKRKKMIIFDDTLDTNKNKILDKSTEEQFLKTTKQLKIYTNQIKYNIALCYLANDEIQKAQSQLKQMKIDKSENFYQTFFKFKSAVLNQTFVFENEEVLPNKNKFSQFLPTLEIHLKQKNHKLKVKICVPFPKVEPPQIFPTFDESLLKTMTIFGIDVKPQAPWIVKEDNVIKFTQKISYASRLDFNDSEPSSSKTALIDFSNSQFKQKKQLNPDDLQNTSLFSKRFLKHKNSIKIQN